MQAGRKGAQRACRERDMYSVGDNVVYPHHGAGKIMRIEQREVLGRQRDYLTIQILHNDMTVMVPAENAERVGLRKVVKAAVVDDVVGVLRGSATEMPERWSRRYKYNDEKLKTGDIFEVAEVIRNLTIRYAEKDIPTGEKQMLAKAKKILASEFVYARDLSEDEATAFLDDLLAGVHADAQEQAMLSRSGLTPEAPAPLTVA
jgi:CarD family transcriptional regulator